MTRYAKGKNAVFIDDRSGFKKRYKRGVIEPGTNYFMDRRESDGRWNLRDHPQNFSAHIDGDEKPLENPRHDVSNVSVAPYIPPYGVSLSPGL